MGWFKRSKQGVVTPTNEKKKHLKDFGTNAQSVKRLFLTKNMLRI